MKRLITSLVYLFLLAVVLPVSAQKFYAGMIGGVNFADLSMKDEYGHGEETSRSTLFGIGGVFGLGLNQQFYIELEPMYLQKGGVLNQRGADPDIEFETSFIEVPLFLKVFFSDEVRPFLMGGPTVGILLTSEASGNIEGMKFTGDLKDVTRGIDIGFMVGAGMNFPLGKINGFIDGRYEFGLTDLNKGGTVKYKVGGLTQVGEINEQAESRTRGLQFMAGITVPLGSQ